jgi:hypothetical protein
LQIRFFFGVRLTDFVRFTVCALQTLALEFIENAVNVGCMFAKHRNSSILETKDLHLHMYVKPETKPQRSLL